MNSKRKKWTDIKLNRYVKIFVFLHLALVITLFFDSIRKLNFTVANNNFKILNWFFDYRISNDKTQALLASLLVVWTFITALLIFYLGKKDHRFCGTKIWDIVTYDVEKRYKIAIFFEFFAGLFFILFAILVDFSLTISCLLFLYVGTAGAVFAFVCWATEKDTIIGRYYKLVIFQGTHNRSGTNDSLEEKMPVFMTYLHDIPKFNETDWDQLCHLLPGVFSEMCKNEPGLNRKEAEETLFKTMQYILNTIDEQGKRKNFLDNLGKVAYSYKDSVPYPIDFFSAMYLASAEHINSMGNSCFIECVSCIEDEKIRHQLMIRGIVYVAYLDLKSGTSRYSKSMYLLLNAIKGTEILENNWGHVLVFVWEIQKYDPSFTVDQVEKTLS